MGSDQSSPTFAALLRRARQVAGMTQEELAERARLSVRGINDLERGVRRAPRKDTVALLAEALALSPIDRTAFEAAARPPAGAAADSTAPAPGPDRGNLPLTLTSFVGRQQELAAVQHLLAECRLLTLTGAGGCGKTRLALELATSVQPLYPDRVWLVELAALADPALVPQAVAGVLGVREQPTQPLLESLADVLRSRHLLLLLDNCEHLVVACARVAETLLRLCPRLTILATSREALGVAGEQAWRVPSLSVPTPPAAATVEQALAGEAVQLFVQRAQTVQAGFRLTAQNAALVVHVCQRLDGIPLALELAAARLGSLSLAHLAGRLDDRFRLLTGGSRTALPRQQTLRAALDWSHDLLGAAERILFRRLAVFAGGWTLEAAETVCSGADIEAEEVVDLLGGLVRRSLVSMDAEEDGAGSRYRLLETVRQYAQERLLAAGEAERLRDRHLDWYLALAEEADTWPSRRAEIQVSSFEQLDEESDNLRAALAWSRLTPGGMQRGVQLAICLEDWWNMRGHAGAGRRTLQELLDQGESMSVGLQAGAHRALSVLAVQLGDYRYALEQAEAAHRLFVQEGDQRRIAEAFFLQGYALINLGELDRAAVILAELLEIYRGAPPDRWAEAIVVGLMGGILHLQGDFAGAATHYEESLALSREVGDTNGVAEQLANLANVARDLGDFARALQLHRESLGMRRSLRYLAGCAECFEGLAVCAAGAGRPRRAARLFGAAEALREVLGRPIELLDRTPHARWVPVVREALGADVFTALWAEGRALPLERVIDAALGESTRA